MLSIRSDVFYLQNYPPFPIQLQSLQIPYLIGNISLKNKLMLTCPALDVFVFRTLCAVPVLRVNGKILSCLQLKTKGPTAGIRDSGAAPPLSLLPIFLCCALLGISLLTQSREEGGWDSRSRMGFMFSSVSVHWAKVYCISSV